MVAGYTPGRTATISTTVYQLWRTDNDALAFRWVLVNVAISAVVLLVVNLLEKSERTSAWVQNERPGGSGDVIVCGYQKKAGRFPAGNAV